MGNIAAQLCRKIFGIAILCIALGGGFLPSAYADESGETYAVHIGGREMTASGDGAVSYYVNGENGAAGTVYDAEPVGGYNAKLYYDETEGLTLDLCGLVAAGDPNCSLATKGNDGVVADERKCAGIYSDDDLTLVLHDSSKAIGVEFDGTYNWNAAKGSIVSSKTGDSKSYGLYVGGNLTVNAVDGGSLEAVALDADGSCYGIYVAGILVVLDGALKAESGNYVLPDGATSKKNTPESYGVYAGGGIEIGGYELAPAVTAKSGESRKESCGMYGGSGGIEVKGGSVVAEAGRASNGYSDGILVDGGVLSVSGGVVSSTSAGSTSMSTGICAGKLVVSGGYVSGKAGDSSSNSSMGIYAYKGIGISGGYVEGEGAQGGPVENAGTAQISSGIFAKEGDVVLSGRSEMHAIGGPAGYSMGLALRGGSVDVGDNASLYASTCKDGRIRCYSYGMLVCGDFVAQGNAYVESVAGKVGDYVISSSKKEKRSLGIYVGGGTVSTLYDDLVLSGYDPNRFFGESRTVQIANGATVVAQSLGSNESTDAQVYRAAAVAFYNDSGSIDFSSEVCPGGDWYQWRESENGEFASGAEAPYVGVKVSADNRFVFQNSTAYLCVKPRSAIEHIVTFDPNGGSLFGDSSVQVEDGESVDKPVDPIRAGYTFAGWYAGGVNDDGNLVLEREAYEFDSPVTGDFVLYAKWEPAADTGYVVNHWLQRAGDDTEAGEGYVLEGTERLNGATGELTEAKARSYDGFAARPFEQELIAADGSTVIDIYYDLIAPEPGLGPDADQGSLSSPEDDLGRAPSVLADTGDRSIGCACLVVAILAGFLCVLARIRKVG